MRYLGSFFSAATLLFFAGCGVEDPASPGEEVSAGKLTVSSIKAGGFGLNGTDNKGDFSWLVGIDLDIDLFDAERFGHCVALASDGSRIEISGNGLFSNKPNGEKSASGGGEYIMLDPDGTVIAEGSWEATKLIRYIDYGYVLDPDEDLGEPHRGGSLTMDIELEGQGQGRLWIHSEISTPPPELPGQGVQVQLGDKLFDEVLNPNFDDPGLDDGGLTIFRNLALLEANEATDEGTIEQVFADFDPANFTNPTNIDNEWFPFQPGMHWVYEGETVEDGESAPHRIEFTVTDLIKVIDGVRTVVAWVVDISDGEIVESEIAFFAQDDDGTVWFFGEHPEEYEDGEIVETPTWISGIEEALAGVKMVKDPQPDTPIYFQGWAPAVEWSDFGIVAGMVDEICVPVACYSDVLIIDESSLDEVGAFQQKFYARGVGNVHVDWSGDDETKETLDLIEFTQFDAEALAEANALAMEQEARAYEQNPDVYGLTPPME